MIRISGGSIPEHIIEAVLKHHDIVDVIGKYVHLTKLGRNLKGLCPFHSEKSPSFNVNPEKQMFKCFGCGIGGNAITFLRDIEGLTFGEAVRQLAEEANISFGWEAQSLEQTERQREKEHLIKAYDFTAKFYHHFLNNYEEGKAAKSYLQSRGFTDSMIQTFQIGYAPDRWDTLVSLLQKREFDMSLMEKGALITAKSSGDRYLDKFRDRIMFPIRDAKGNVIAFAGRTLGNAQPKYLNSPETFLFRKSKVLYNLHQARQEIKKTSQIVLFEGYADVIKASFAGVQHSVATMGTSLTEDHALLVRRLAEQVILCYDGDDAGQAAAFKNLALLQKNGLEVKVAMIPNKLDPDDYIETFGAERFRHEIIDGAVPTERFRLHYLRRNFNLSDNEARARYVRTAIQEVLADIPSPTIRELYLRELASEFSSTASLEAMKQEMNEVREQLQKKRKTGDNNEISWNNVRNDGADSAPLPKLRPAYDKAERHLLYMMLHDRSVSALVQERLGDAFNNEAHAALAAYLYAYYAQGYEPNASRYTAALQDERLERLAASILMTESDQGVNEQVIEDYLRQIQKHRQLLAIERMKEEMKIAEREKDFLRAAQIASEITTLNNQLK